MVNPLPVSLLKMIFVVIFLGWLLIWIMMPTNYYKQNWIPKFAKTLNTTYFGPQGTYLVLLTVPMMLIAVLSCVYLHFYKTPRQNTFDDSNSKKRSPGLGALKRPVLVMNPLGIVTALELIFAFLFMALLIWSFAHYLYVSYGHLHMHKEGEKVWQAKFRAVWLRLGYVGHICWAFLFFPVTRGSSILPLVGLTSESSIKYHIWLGHISNFLFLLHTVGFIIYWAITDQIAEMLEWSPTYVSNVAGEIAMVIGIGMWVTSIRSVRRKLYEVFYYTHQLYGLYILFYVIHVGDSWFCMILPNIFLFFIDRYLRFLQSQTSSRVLSSRILPSGSIELTFSKTPGLYYNPTSIIFMHVPSISRMQWHPFTVTSNCNLEPDILSVVIKRQGSWTQKLYQQISSSSTERLQVSTEGPYGPQSFHLLRHESIILVSGGSGITPMISVIREIIFQTQNQNFKPPNILLVCAFKQYQDLAVLDLLFPPSGVSEPEISKLNLKIEAYITKENAEPKTVDAQNKLLQTKFFKPNPQDMPVSPVLGPNNLLWLAAIILSSFAMFLLLIGIVTRFHIYPVDKNTGKIYNFTYRTLWDMFLGCVCVFVASSVVFLLCKKQNAAAEGKQVQNVEMQTPAASPGSWFYGADRELESVPYQSVVQATNIHFGSRPNIKKILLDVQGSEEVGVMVCGPRKMRHEVAKICASGLAKNLHFEAISFNL